MDSGYLCILQEYIVHVRDQCCNAPVVVMLANLLILVQLHFDHDFLAMGLRPTFLVPFHLQFLVWPAPVAAADFLLGVSAGFPG